MVGQALNYDNIEADELHQVLCDDLESIDHQIAQSFDKLELEKFSQVGLPDSGEWNYDLIHHSEIRLSSNSLQVEARLDHKGELRLCDTDACSLDSEPVIDEGPSYKGQHHLVLEYCYNN